MENNIGFLFEELYGKVNILYKFVNLMNFYAKNKHSSKIDKELTMTEIHMLVDISESENVTVTEIAKATNRTKGAVSQIITKLEKKGYIEKNSDTKDAKISFLTLSATGKAISDEHKRHDITALLNTNSRLLEECSMEEIESFYKVLIRYNEILTEDIQKF